MLQGIRLKISKADKLFSWVIRFRDNWTCQFCRWPADETKPEDRFLLDCSHYFERKFKSTRFDPENCVAACKGCHRRLNGINDPDYKAFMIRRLGKRAYDLLWIRGHTTAKADESLMQLWCTQELTKMGVDPKTGRRFKQALSGPGIMNGKNL